MLVEERKRAGLTQTILAFHEFLLSLGHSKSYAHHTISTGRAAHKHALNKRYIAVAPLIQTYFSKKEKDAAPPKGRPMSLNEIGALLDQFGEENNTDHVLKFCLTMLNTMCRPDAAFDLHSWQIDDEFGYVQLNPEGRVQTDKFRQVVPLTEAMAHLLAGVRGPIVQIDGNPISSVKHAWATARSNAKLDDRVQPYSLRHSLSRYLIHRKVPRYQNSLMLGHAVPEARHRSPMCRLCSKKRRLPGTSSTRSCMTCRSTPGINFSRMPFTRPASRSTNIRLNCRRRTTRPPY